MQIPNGVVVGAACVTINPPPGVPLIGYPTPRPNRGIDLDLCLRAIVFGNVDEEKPAAALLAVDTLSTGADIVAKLRARVSEALPDLDAASVMIAATHTHSAPVLDTFYKNPPDAAYMAQVIAAAGDVVKRAWQSRACLSMRVGLTEVRLASNRRVVDPSGKAVNEWLDADARHHGYCNPNVRFLTFSESGTARVRVILNTYGCHPVTLGPENALASPDYPGYLVRALEEKTRAIAVHVTGAAANINPRLCLFGDSAHARAMGETIARAIAEALPATRTGAATPVTSHTERLTLTLGPNAQANYSGRAAQSVDGKTLSTDVQAIRLGEVALVSAPGELFAEIGTSVENASPFVHTFVMGYANDNLGYLCTETAMREGAYEASSPISEDFERPYLAVVRKALGSLK